MLWHTSHNLGHTSKDDFINVENVTTESIKNTRCSPILNFQKSEKASKKHSQKWICTIKNIQSTAMSSYNNTPNQRQQYASFNCSKTHTFIHLVCHKCLKIYHERCISQIAGKISFLGGHEINYYEKDTTATEISVRLIKN